MTFKTSTMFSTILGRLLTFIIVLQMVQNIGINFPQFPMKFLFSKQSSEETNSTTHFHNDSSNNGIEEFILLVTHLLYMHAQSMIRKVRDSLEEPSELLPVSYRLLKSASNNNVYINHCVADIMEKIQTRSNIRWMKSSISFDICGFHICLARWILTAIIVHFKIADVEFSSSSGLVETLINYIIFSYRASFYFAWYQFGYYTSEKLYNLAKHYLAINYIREAWFTVLYGPPVERRDLPWLTTLDYGDWNYLKAVADFTGKTDFQIIMSRIPNWFKQYQE